MGYLEVSSTIWLLQCPEKYYLMGKEIGLFPQVHGKVDIGDSALFLGADLARNHSTEAKRGRAE